LGEEWAMWINQNYRAHEYNLPHSNQLHVKWRIADLTFRL